MAKNKLNNTLEFYFIYNKIINYHLATFYYKSKFLDKQKVNLCNKTIRVELFFLFKSLITYSLNVQSVPKRM